MVSDARYGEPGCAAARGDDRGLRLDHGARSKRRALGGFRQRPRSPRHSPRGGSKTADGVERAGWIVRGVSISSHSPIIGVRAEGI